MSGRLGNIHFPFINLEDLLRVAFNFNIFSISEGDLVGCVYPRVSMWEHATLQNDS